MATSSTYSESLAMMLLLIISTFSAFRYCCRARGEKLEKTDLQYGCLAETVRRGGFKVALIARYSAIPGHCECMMYIFPFESMIDVNC